MSTRIAGSSHFAGMFAGNVDDNYTPAGGAVVGRVMASLICTSASTQRHHRAFFYEG